jgi:hypothetical protein
MIEDRKAVEAKQRFHAALAKKLFPTIGMVYSVHEGPNRAQRRAVRFKKVGKANGKPTNTQKPAFF